MAGLYVHVPFRRARRPYDDAYYVPTDAADFESYVTAINRELIHYAQEYAEEERIETVYAGGGRPSLFSMSNVRNVLQTVLDVFDASAFKEATAEVSPLDADPTYLSSLRSVGFDRLHLEVLSFFPDDLRVLDTPHAAQDSVRAIRHARQAGFDNLSVELLFGWPHQSTDRWRQNLEQAVDMEIPHLTVTEWTGDADALSTADAVPSASPKGSALTSPAASDSTTERRERDAEIQAAKQFQLAMDVLSDHGYTQYELTHFARPNHRSIHQDNYYAHGNYLGVGASAHTFWWPGRMQQVPARRWANVRDVDRYADLLAHKYPPISYRQTIDWTSLGNEYVMLRLRTHEGLDLRRLKAEYGYDLMATKPSIVETLLNHGLIAREANHRLRLTPRGRLVADGITERLVR